MKSTLNNECLSGFLQKLLPSESLHSKEKLGAHFAAKRKL